MPTASPSPCPSRLLMEEREDNDVGGDGDGGRAAAGAAQTDCRGETTGVAIYPDGAGAQSNLFGLDIPPQIDLEVFPLGLDITAKLELFLLSRFEPQESSALSTMYPLSTIHMFSKMFLGALTSCIGASPKLTLIQLMSASVLEIAGELSEMSINQ